MQRDEDAIILRDGGLLELLGGGLLGKLERFVHRAARDAVEEQVVVVDEFVKVNVAGAIRVRFRELGTHELGDGVALEGDALALQ